MASRNTQRAMTTPSIAEDIKFDTAGFENLLASSSEPDWLKNQRANAWKQFDALGWPTRSQEDWMRSDLRGFKLDRYAFPADQTAKSLAESGIAQWLKEGITPAGSLETLDGTAISESLSESAVAKGVIFGDLSRIASEHPELVETYLGTVIDGDQDKFAALHTAAWSGGHFLYVPKGVQVDEPLYVSAGLTDGACDIGRTLIVLDEGAEATFLYEANSSDPGAKGFHAGGVEIVVKSGAHLRYVNLQDWGRGVWNFAHHRATVDRDASIQWTVAALGSKFSQVSQKVSLVGEGAYSQVNGVLFTQERQQLTYNTHQHHHAAHCRSDFLYKAALQDQSRTVWRGMIGVDPGAQKTDGYQRNDNLLLSDQARADSIPGLEILADDVRCTHGSTSGKVDEELIFYAQSRGFTRKEAVRMIVTGFFQQIFDRITIESVREALGLSIARQVREYS